MIRTVQVSVDTTGSAGSATGSASSGPVAGEVLAVHVDYHASAPNTTDVTVTCEADDDHPAVTVYGKDNSATDAWVYPVVEQTSTAGAGTSTYQNVVVSGTLKVALAGCNALTAAAVVTFWLRE